MRVKILGRVRNIPDVVILFLVDLILFLFLVEFAIYFYRNTPYFNTSLAISIFIALLVPFLYFYSRYRRIQESEKYFPQFLKDLADIHRTGMSIVQSVYSVSKQEYGPLSPHIKKLAIRLSWGVPFEEAFQRFAEETGSPLIKSAVLIILEAFSSGGNVPEVLETVAEDTRKMKDMQEEKKSRFANFVGTMYVVFLVSIGLSYVLLDVLMPEMPVLPSFKFNFGGAGLPSASTGVSSIPESAMKTLFLHLMIIQAIISGFMAGLIGEGSWTAGLKHVLIMGFLTLVLFQIFILPVDPVDRIGRTIAKLTVATNTTIQLGTYYVEKNITVADIQNFIKNYHKGFGGVHRSFSITFQQIPPCKPCQEGLVTVRPDGVFIKKPVYLSFKVVSSGKGSVTVYVS